MKKILSTLIISGCLFTFLNVKKAEAGLYLQSKTPMGTCHDHDEWGHHYEHPCHVGSFEASAFALSGVAIIFYETLYGPKNTAAIVAGAFLIVLDENNANGSLANTLSERYPFIDNSEVLTNLADTILNKKLEITKDATALALVTLPENEVRQVLSSVDLNESEINFIVNDLK